MKQDAEKTLPCTSVSMLQRQAQLNPRRLQAPGPPGSPQEPQGDAADMLAPLLVDTAKVESWGDSFLLWHLGHSAFCSP